MNTKYPTSTGVVEGIAFRTDKGCSMSEVSECQVIRDCGLSCENRGPGRRSITLLSREAWAQTCDELGTVLPWPTRRANLLVSGLDLRSLVGGAVMIGEVRVWIHDETRPCALMDQLCPGLRAALKPDFRGGVFGQTLTDGVIRIGNVLRIDPIKQDTDDSPKHT